MSEKPPVSPWHGVKIGNKHIVVNDGDVQQWRGEYSRWLDENEVTPEEQAKADELVEEYKRVYEENKRKRKQDQQ